MLATTISIHNSCNPQQNTFSVDWRNVRNTLSKQRLRYQQTLLVYTCYVNSTKPHFMWAERISKSILKPKIWMLITLYVGWRNNRKKKLKQAINISITTPSMKKSYDRRKPYFPWTEEYQKNTSKPKIYILITTLGIHRSCGSQENKTYTYWKNLIKTFSNRRFRY